MTRGNASPSNSRVSHSPVSGPMLSPCAMGSVESCSFVCKLSLRQVPGPTHCTPKLPPLPCDIFFTSGASLSTRCLTVHLSISSVPPEAVNISLGLSLTAATNPAQLLVSTFGHTGGSSGEGEGPEAVSLGVLWRLEVQGLENTPEENMPLSSPPSVPRPVVLLCTTYAERTHT